MDIKKIECAMCMEVKPRMAKFDAKGSRYFVDPVNDRLWHGRECPECVDLEDSGALDMPAPKSRKCRECHASLTGDRYFECTTCKPQLTSLDDDWIYDSFGLDVFDERMYEDLMWGTSDGQSESEEADFGSDITDEGASG